MRRLLLLRHAKTERSSPKGDRERRLTKRGEEDARRLAPLIAKTPPDLALTSSAARSVETLELVLDAAFPRLVEDDLYLATEGQILERLRRTDDAVRTLLAVGHNPGFGELASSLAGSGESRELLLLREKFPTCALADLVFDVDHWALAAPGGGALLRYVTPAILRGDDDDDGD